ncbi:MAG: beta-propeller fold lactonase family protein, partial [Candidatus Eremiobacteraeota bacterium]|nr:beta-propeller fold lactonase family protein [Candidatus Eremiobacteraeota bacterium]
MRRTNFFIIYMAWVLAAATIAVGAGCAGGGTTGGGGGNPTPAPIPAADYYVNGGMNVNEIFGFSTAPVGVTGTPAPLNNSPYSTVGANGSAGAPFGITLAKGGSVLFAVNNPQGSVSAFTVNGDASLTLVSSTNTQGAAPSGVCAAPNGTVAAVADTGSNQLETFTIAANGTLAQAHVTAPSQNGLDAPLDCAFSPDSAHVYVTDSAGASGISAFSVDGAGNITTIATYSVDSGMPAQGIAISSAATPLVFATTQAGNGMGVYAISSGGVLSPQAFQPTAIAPIGVAVAPNAQSVYVAAAGAKAVDGFHINGFSLSELSGAPYTTQATQSAYPSISSAGSL